MKFVGATGLGSLWALELASRNKHALPTRLRNLSLKSQFSIFDNFQDICVQIYDFFKFCGRLVGGLCAFKWPLHTADL